MRPGSRGQRQRQGRAASAPGLTAHCNRRGFCGQRPRSLGVHTCLHTGSDVPHVSLITGAAGRRGCIWYHSSESGLIRYLATGDHCWANSQVTPCLSGLGKDIRRSGPTDSQKSLAAEPFPSTSALLTLSAPCLSDGTRPLRKEWGKRKELRQDPGHTAPRPVLSRSLLSHGSVTSWALSATPTTLEATVSPACFCRTQSTRQQQGSQTEPQARLLSSLQCLELCVGLPNPTPQGLGTFCGWPVVSSTMKASKLAVVDEPNDQNWERSEKVLSQPLSLSNCDAIPDHVL